MDTQTAPLSAQSASVTRRAVLPLILFAGAISIFQHYSLSAVMPQVSGSLKLSLSQMGVAFSALSFAVLAGYPLFGLLLNLTGTRYGYPAVVAGSSVATAATASAAGVVGLMIPSALQGLFAGGFAPAAIDLIAEWYPVRFHGLAVGLIQAVLALGAAVAVPALGMAADSWSWRAVMLLAGGLGVLWLPLWLGLVRSSGSREPLSFAVLGFPQTWALALGLFFLAPVNAFLFTWFPHYARQTFGLTRGWIQWGGLSGMAVVGVLAVAGGLASDLLLRSGWSLSKSRTVVAGVCALLASSVALLGFVVRAVPANFLAVVVMGASLACTTVLYAAVADAGPRRGVAFAAGMGAFYGLLSTLLCMRLAAIVINRYGFRPMFWIMGVFPLAALACIVPLCAHMRSAAEPAPPPLPPTEV